MCIRDRVSEGVAVAPFHLRDGHVVEMAEVREEAAHEEPVLVDFVARAVGRDLQDSERVLDALETEEFGALRDLVVRPVENSKSEP